jgi:replication factor C subunit 2/4
MLFYGPPGTGKTSTVLALAKQLYGPELFKTRVLELNASDERGISIVREKVKDFARMQLSNPPSGPAGEEYRKKYPCPPYKIIVLDEADSMTQDAQSALRRTMETYSKITRFCLVCNYVTRIIDPLASRCSKFRFKSLDEGNAGKRLEDIARLEDVKLDDGVVTTLLRCSEGDLRKAITFLQSAARLVGLSKPSLKAETKRGKGRLLPMTTTRMQWTSMEPAKDQTLPSRCKALRRSQASSPLRLLKASSQPCSRVLGAQFTAASRERLKIWWRRAGVQQLSPHSSTTR